MSGLDPDIIVLSDDPGGLAHSPVAQNGNLIRLVVGSLNGVRRASHDIVMKIRTDAIFHGNACLNHFNAWPKRRADFRIFDERIIVPNIGTADPEVHVCFQISDWTMLGTKKDLIHLFDISLDKANGTNKSPEQYIWLSAIQKIVPGIDIDNINDKTPQAVQDTISFMTNNLVILDTMAQYQFHCEKYKHLPDDQSVNMRHAKWATWYEGIQ